MQDAKPRREPRLLLCGDGTLIRWPHACPDIHLTTLRSSEVLALLSPHAWERCIAHAPLKRHAVVRLYSASPHVRDRGLALWRAGKRIVAADLQEDVCGLNEETLKAIFARSSDRLELVALIYAHNPKGRFFR